MDCGHLSLGKVQYHAPASNFPHYNYTKLATVQRSETPDYTGCTSSKSSKVKRNKSSSAADAYLYRGPETRRLLSERKFQLNRSNPNLWEYSEERRPKWSGCERRSGSHPSLAPVQIRAPPPASASRSARSTTWCCGTFVKQLTKSHLD